MPQPQLDETLVTLFETNAGCELPCWWGITPGVTTWGQAFQILEQLPIRIYFSNIGNQIIIQGCNAFGEELIYLNFIMEQNRVISIITVPLVKEYPYHLSDAIELYGLPDVIILKTWYPLADGFIGYTALYEDMGALIN